jgi:hypothetical protein
LLRIDEAHHGLGLLISFDIEAIDGGSAFALMARACSCITDYLETMAG